MRATAMAIAMTVMLATTTTNCDATECTYLPFMPRGAAKWATVFTLPGAIFTSATEQDGALFVSTQDGRIYRNSSLWLDLRGMVDASGEGGLNSIAADETGNLYAFLITRDRRLMLYRVALSSSEVVPVIDLGPAGPRHNAGGMLWHDGWLFVGVGDQAPDNDALRLAALSDDSYIGKVLRVQPDARMVEIYARGFRMPWALAWQWGALYVADVGEQRFEELNRVERGESYGWPCYEGNEPRQYAPSVCSMTFQPPVVVYGRNIGRAMVGIGDEVVVDFDGAVIDRQTVQVIGHTPGAPVSAAYQSSRGLYVMSFEDGIGRIHLWQ